MYSQNYSYKKTTIEVGKVLGTENSTQLFCALSWITIFNGSG